MANDVVLNIDPRPGNARNSEGSFIALKDGRLLFVYTRFAESDRDQGAAVLAGRYSSDDGRTWTQDDEVFVENLGACNVMSVTLLRLQDDRIAMFFLRKDDTYSRCIPMVQFSSDEALTWTKPQPMIHTDGYYVLNNDRVIQLKSGRLLAPLALHRVRTAQDEDGKPAIRHTPGAIMIFCYSDDGGRTWLESPQNLFVSYPNSGGLQEPGVVAMDDGRIWGYARMWGHNYQNGPTTQPCIWEFFSENDGLTWTQPCESKFQSPASPMCVKRIEKTGHLLAVWNDRSPASLAMSGRRDGELSPRSPLAIAMSADNGDYWHHYQQIETSPQHGFCYTAIHETSEAVLFAYCAGGVDTGNRQLNRLRIRRMTWDALYPEGMPQDS